MSVEADLRFPLGGDVDPGGGGCQHTILPNFTINCMKLRRFWAPRSATGLHVYLTILILKTRLFPSLYCVNITIRSQLFVVSVFKETKVAASGGPGIPRAVADPGFPRRGHQPQSFEKKNLLFDKIFEENCIKMKEIGPREARP